MRITLPLDTAHASGLSHPYCNQRSRLQNIVTAGNAYSYRRLKTKAQAPTPPDLRNSNVLGPRAKWSFSKSELSTHMVNCTCTCTLHKRVQLKSRQPHCNLISRNVNASPNVLSPSSILPSPSSRCAFSRTKKNSARVSKNLNIFAPLFKLSTTGSVCVCVFTNSSKHARFAVNQGRILVTSGNVCYYPVKTLLSVT